MKKIGLLLLCIAMLFGMFIPTEQISSSAISTQIVVTTDYTYLYKNANKTERYDFKIYCGEKLTYNNQTNGFYEVIYSYENTHYSGFIWGEHATPYAPNQQIILTYNATITKNTPAYNMNDNSVMEGVTITKGTRIFLYEGYSSKKDYLPARFISNGEVITARIKIDFIKPDGVNKALIIAITSIIAVVGVVLILLGLGKKKWHKRLKKHKKQNTL